MFDQGVSEVFRSYHVTDVSLTPEETADVDSVFYGVFNPGRTTLSSSPELVWHPCVFMFITIRTQLNISKH